MKPDLSDAFCAAGALVAGYGLWLLLPPGAVLLVVGLVLLLTGAALGRPRKD